MHYLSVCVIARNESRYIEEWVQYHLGLGVEHFFVYNNDSGERPMCEKLHKWLGKEVTLIGWPGQVQQPPVYMNCLNTFRFSSRWMAFIDVDEFLVPLKTDNMQTFLKPYERYSAVCPHWYIFGSSGERTYRPIPVLERFTRRAAEVDRHIKSIVDPSKTFRWVTAHKFTHTTPAVDEHENPIPETESRPEPATADFIQLNHYVTKSYEESVERRSSPGASRADIAETRKMPEFFDAHDKNEVEDLTALNYWLKIKQK